MKHAETIAEMKAWCLENYENGADTMVECWDTSDYVDNIERCGGDVEEAWKVLKAVAGVYADRQADARHYRENA